MICNMYWYYTRIRVFWLQLGVCLCLGLEQFLITIASLRSALTNFEESEIMNILVIDDSSSSADRLLMMRSLPEASFLFKSQPGHARSLNLMMRLVSTIFDDYCL